MKGFITFAEKVIETKGIDKKVPKTNEEIYRKLHFFNKNIQKW